MAVSTHYKAFVCELLSGLGVISTRNMFGGVGIYCEGVIFAVIGGDVLYLKVDEAMKVDLADLGCGPFIIDFGKGEGPKPMNGYWEMPQSAMDDADEACVWGRRALDYALHMQRQKKSKKKR